MAVLVHIRRFWWRIWPPKLKLSPGERIAAVAVMISTVSLCVAIKSYKQGAHSLVLAERESDGARNILWTGAVNEKGELPLTVANSDARVSAVRVILPKGMPIESFAEDAVWPHGELKPPNYAIPTGGIFKCLEEHIRNAVLYKDGYVTTSLGMVNGETQYMTARPVGAELLGIAIQQRSSGRLIPLVIESSCILKGYVHVDTALYYIHYFYIFQIGPGLDSWRIDQIRLQQISYAGRLVEGGAQEVVDKLWEQLRPLPIKWKKNEEKIEPIRVNLPETKSSPTNRQNVGPPH